ncbi:hypothetical protein [Tenacibaculum geojense]|uniref:Uncharacterized protein n=1 Tax=Tenacibaculum geojense TaxID=915352 RepID=A0ABW3JSK3_9FLAO
MRVLLLLFCLVFLQTAIYSQQRKDTCEKEEDDELYELIGERDEDVKCEVQPQLASLSAIQIIKKKKQSSIQKTSIRVNKKQPRKKNKAKVAIVLEPYKVKPLMGNSI